MITDVPGVRCGHWTDRDALTGCTVVLLPPSTVAAAEVRGGAPASRELDALGVGRLVEHADAVVLTGGSAFGLAAADGVMAWCEEHGIGYPTGSGVVPIVPTLAVFDLANGDGSVRPGPDEGRAACEAATGGRIDMGQVGAGTGALVGKWRGASNVQPGGVASATATLGPLIVSSIVVVNAFGDIDRQHSGDRECSSASAAAVEWLNSSLAGKYSPLSPAGTGEDPFSTSDDVLTNTTVGLVVTNARLDRIECHLLAQGAHDGLARAIVPPHTRFDGDAFIAAATGQLDLSTFEQPVDVDTVRLLAVVAVERAIRAV